MGAANNAGVSYVIYGGASLNDINLATLTSVQGFYAIGTTYSQSGYSVSGAGDVNKDGYEDVIIGAPYANNYAGESYVIYGGASLNDINLATLTSAQGFYASGTTYSQSGYSVSSVGDINKDGYDDVIVGSPGANNDAGVSYIIYGSVSGFITESPSYAPTSSPTSTSKTILSLSSLAAFQGININGAVSSYSGYSTSAAGDVNSDGYDDVIIGAPYANNYAGESYVIYGGLALAQTIDLIQIGEQGFTISGDINSYSGSSVAGIGDTNKDGYADISVCSPNTGVSYVIYGGTSISSLSLINLISAQGFSITGDIPDGESGYSVSSAGDVNGDGYDDIIIGANNAGAYVVYGGVSFRNFNLANLTPSQGFFINGVSSIGCSVAGAGDINNDGYDDIIIGAFSDGKNSNIGEPEIPPPITTTVALSYVVYGGFSLKNVDLSTLSSAQGFSISGAPAHSTITCTSIAGAVDVNNDGYDDVIIGVLGVNNNAGVSYVIYGNSSLENINLATLHSTQGFYINGTLNSWSGRSVSGAGDVNKDGYDDVIIGAPDANNYAGESYVIYGGSSLKNIDLATLTLMQGFYINGTLNSRSGTSVAGAGDINKDGYADIIIGAPGANNNAGVSYVIYGSLSSKNIDLATLISAQGFSILGVTVNSYSGIVAGAGDVNGDGYNDVIVGSNSANNSQGEFYVIYVVYGSASLNDIDLSALTSAQGFSISWNSGFDSNYVGYSVASAGDINNDGYNDVIIGFPYASDYLEGISYIVYGGNSIDNINLDGFPPNPQGFSISGAATSITGYRIAGAGDINNDGYTDIIIGNSIANNGAGTSYIIYGGFGLSNIDLTSLTSTRGFSISGTQANSASGYSVAGAGDINNDGYDDIIIGAPNTNNGIGSVYIIFGGTSLSNINLVNLISTQGFTISGIASSKCGWSVAGAGDVNKDGYPDIIIGAPITNNAAGISYVIYGGDSLTSLNLVDLSIAQGFFIAGAIANSYSGNSVAGAGDINNDGYDDMIIGAPYTNSYAGESYIIYGGTLLNNINLANVDPSQGFYISGAPPYSGSGFSVAGIGDINNDNYADIIVSAPNAVYANSIAGESFVIYGSASGFTTLAPTLAPTPIPTSSPNNDNAAQVNLLETAGIKTAFSLASFALSVIGGYLLRNKIAFYVLNNWGHEYKLLYKDSNISLKKHEIGLYAKEQELLCIIKNEEYFLPIDDSIHNGISNQLHTIIIQALKNPLISQSFTFIQPEKNQIRNFLIKNKYLATQKTYCFLDSFMELGYIKGSIYNLFLKHFEISHANMVSKQVRFGIDSKIPMKELSSSKGELNTDTSNPMIKSKFIDQSMESSIELSNMAKGDIESHATVNSIHSVIHNNPLLNHPQSLEIFKYALEIGGKKAINTLLEYQGYISNDVNEIKATIKEVFTDTAPTAKLTEPTSTVENMHSPVSSNNNLMISLLSVQQIVEYIPIVKYMAQGFNITLPEILDNKPMLVTTHLVLGNAAAALLSYESITNGMITSSIATSSYAMRLVSAGYLAAQRQETLAQDAPMNNFEMVKYCGASILAYTLPTLAKCAVTKWFIPDAECSYTGYDISISASFAGADCYAMYKATSELTTPTTADVVVPYILDTIAFAITSQYVSIDVSSGVMTMQSVKQCMSVVASVVATDYIGRVVMDMVPVEIKESYMELIFNYADDIYACGVDAVNQILGSTQEI
ncbi:MAG: hypothetical protein WBJ81_00250 [Rickettsiales bacterium]